VQAKQENRFRAPDEELKKLLDPSQAFFIVSRATVRRGSSAGDRQDRAVLKRPDLILLTDDVYGTFVPGFRSLMGAFPKNTISVSPVR
jgi:aspartate 4-decarboxylase